MFVSFGSKIIKKLKLGWKKKYKKLIISFINYSKHKEDNRYQKNIEEWSWPNGYHHPLCTKRVEVQNLAMAKEGCVFKLEKNIEEVSINGNLA